MGGGIAGNQCSPRHTIGDQITRVDQPTEEDHHVKIWIIDLCTVTTSDSPFGAPGTNNTYGHDWISTENLAASYLAGVTDLSSPAGQWDPDKMQRKLLLPARSGTYPPGDFVFMRDEGSNNVTSKLEEYALQSIELGRQRFEKVKRIIGSGVIDQVENEKKKTNSPGFWSFTHIWPGMWCAITITTAYGSKPIGEELNPAAVESNHFPFRFSKVPFQTPLEGGRRRN